MTDIDRYKDDLRDIVLKLYPSLLKEYPDLSTSERIAKAVETADELLLALNQACEREEERQKNYQAAMDMDRALLIDLETENQPE